MTLARLVAASARIANASWFQNFIIGVILFNAVIIGMETYGSLTDSIGSELSALNDVCLGIFTVEIGIRVVAYGDRPGQFFRSGWNVFDFVVVGVAYLPWVRESIVLLRLARLLRITRLLSVMPGLRVILIGMRRSLPPLGSLIAMTFFLLYLYGMLGWLLFHDHDPKNFGTIGAALGTLFQILTLEGWNEVLSVELQQTTWAWLYFVSFVLISAFVILNVVIGIVVNSMDEAREIERREEIQRRLSTEHGQQTSQEWLPDRLEALRDALDDLEGELRRRGDLPPTH